MSKTKKKSAKIKKNNLSMGKEFYGSIPIEKCFKKAFEPYFCKEKSKYLKNLS